MYYPYQMNGMPDQLQQLRYQQIPMHSGMVWVRNRFDAENYPVAPNTAIALWDMSAPLVHRKETDVSGRPTLKTYQLVEVTDAQRATNNTGAEFVTRQEFQSLVDSLSTQGRYVRKEETNE